MSDLKTRLTEDLKEAMRTKDRTRLLVVRAILTAITAREKEGGNPPSEEEIVGIIQKQAKQRKDSISQFEDAGRQDLVDNEQDELAIIENYLPAQASDEEVAAVVKAVIERTGASSKKEFGRVMGEAMRELKGIADGDRVRQAVTVLLPDG